MMRRTYSALGLDRLDEKTATFKNAGVVEVTLPREIWEGDGHPTMVWVSIGDGPVPPRSSEGPPS